MRKSAWLLIIVTLSLALTGCSKHDIYVRTSFFAMDTNVEIKIDNGFDNPQKIFDECKEIISDLEIKTSKTIPGSEISKINSNTATGLSEDTLNIISDSLKISRICPEFDITTAAFTDLWNECAERQSLPEKQEISYAKLNVGYDKIHFEDNRLIKDSDNTKIDLGAVGKGYAADILVKFLEDSGVKFGIVSFGSCIAVFGEKNDKTPFKIGIKNPYDTSEIYGYVYMRHGVLSVTGDYERFFEINGKKYHHVISPHTGYPSDNGVHSCVVVCDKGSYADALSTGIFVRGEFESLYKRTDIDFECILIGDDNIKITDGLNQNFEYKNKN